MYESILRFAEASEETLYGLGWRIGRDQRVDRIGAEERVALRCGRIGRSRWWGAEKVAQYSGSPGDFAAQVAAQSGRGPSQGFGTHGGQSQLVDGG